MGNCGISGFWDSQTTARARHGCRRAEATVGLSVSKVNVERSDDRETNSGVRRPPHPSEVDVYKLINVGSCGFGVRPFTVAERPQGSLRSLTQTPNPPNKLRGLPLAHVDKQGTARNGRFDLPDCPKRKQRHVVPAHGSPKDGKATFQFWLTASGTRVSQQGSQRLEHTLIGKIDACLRRNWMSQQPTRNEARCWK